MDDQRELIADTDWDILIIFDACRADSFQEETGRGHTVRSPAPNTAKWVYRMRDVWADIKPVYLSSNPVASRTLHDMGMRHYVRDLHNCWDRLWGRFTAQSVPGVHPMSVNGYLYGIDPEPDVPVVVHYLPPHSPYMGNPPLRLARWGDHEGELYQACHQLHRPDRAIEAGECTWDEVREAYRGNLRLAWDAARQLAMACPNRRVVVTADHGEYLGENDRFGHQLRWEGDDLLHEVPWLAINDIGGSAGQESIRERMEALGYA